MTNGNTFSPAFIHYFFHEYEINHFAVLIGINRTWDDVCLIEYNDGTKKEYLGSDYEDRIYISKFFTSVSFGLSAFSEIELSDFTCEQKQIIEGVVRLIINGDEYINLN